MADEPILIDTDVYSALQLGDGPWAELLRDRELILSFVTIGEVIHGRRKLGWGDDKLGEELRRLRAFRVIAGTEEVAVQYGVVARLFKGQMPDNDLWIAACALAVPLPLATGDGNHFMPIASALPLTLVRP